MGLVETIELPKPAELGPVHFIAIGGSGMNGVATAFLQLGIPVSGSDRQDSPYLRALEAAGARVYVGHAAAQLGDARTVVASSAIREDNPELAEAKRRGLRVLHRSAALGSLMLGRRGIAVAGTHGKTTTTAMIASVLTGAGVDPSFVIGGALTGSKSGGHIGGGNVLVIEADESDGSFLQYPAEIAVVTNVDPDHLINWGSAENYADGFIRFATGNTAIEIVTFGESEAADVRFSGADFVGTGSSFELRTAEEGGPVTLSVPGDYNVRNAAASYAVGAWLGVPDEVIRVQLAKYRGTYRRFQLVGTVNGIRVYDDYAHHPTEVANTLAAARPGVGDGRVVVCFQPHLYTRTRDF